MDKQNPTTPPNEETTKPRFWHVSEWRRDFLENQVDDLLRRIDELGGPNGDVAKTFAVTENAQNRAALVWNVHVVLSHLERLKGMAHTLKTHVARSPEREAEVEEQVRRSVAARSSKNRRAVRP